MSLSPRAVVRLASAALVLATLSFAQSPATRPGGLRTRFAADVDPRLPHPEHPRPTFERAEWMNLNGPWDYALVAADAPLPTTYEGSILVPFPLESALSGVARTLEPERRLVYRRRVKTPEAYAGKRLLLHFGAVDWRAEVYVDGRKLGEHEGGYDPFTFDATQALIPGREQELVVVVADPTDRGGQPRGKQREKPSGIWYTRTSGIWRTVWLEPVAHDGFRRLDVAADSARGELAFTVEGPPPGSVIAVAATAPDGEILTATKDVAAESGPLRFTLPVPKPVAWSPDRPALYRLRATTTRPGESAPCDVVATYAAFRDVAVRADASGVARIHVNGRPLFWFGPLDQGYWPDGLYTAPTDAALRFDVEAVKRMGGNMLRKHAKVEPERFYYWCDVLGVLVWQDVPSGFEPEKGDQAGLAGIWRDVYRREMRELLADYARHPSLVAWTAFNEGWGQFETEAIVAEMKAADPTRLVVGASGWTDRGVGDFVDVHAYPGPGMAPPEPKRATVLGEFGGLGHPVAGRTWLGPEAWGYVTYADRAALGDAYCGLLERLPPLIAEGLSAAVYTQTTDVEGEVNGWLTYDREVWKIDPERARAAAAPLYAPPPRVKVLIPRAGQGPRAVWRYTTEDPGAGFAAESFDDAAWKEGPAGFGAAGTPGANLGTEWKTGALWIRRTFDLAGPPPATLAWSLHHDEDVEIFLNGVAVYAEKGYTSGYVLRALDAKARAALKPGRNVLALRCRQTTGGQYLDCGLAELEPAK
jgi:hypothetical protein